MGNDISIVRRAAAVAAALALAACQHAAQKETEAAPSAAAPAAAPAPAPAPAEENNAASMQAGAVESVQLQDNAPLRYVVQKGDTLWGIANKFLKDSWQWPEVWYVNPKVKNPHLIYPGDELYLYFVNGRPQVAKAGEGPAQAAPPADVLPPGGKADITPHARVTSTDQAVFSIPVEQVRAFLQGPRMVDGDALDGAPYVVDFEENHLMAGPDNMAYVLHLDKQKKHALWQIVRKGEKYKDPDNNDTIGYEVLPVADTEVSAYGDPATVYLRRSYMEALAGDILLPMETDPLASRFVPHAPAKLVDGKIISVYNGMSNIGQYQVVAINRGTKQGMDPGTVLTVYQHGREAPDPNTFFHGDVQLPDIRCGTVMVFKTFERMSYALVMKATHEIHILDKVEQPAVH